MRLLCDQNVDQRYVDAFVATNDFSAVTVRAVLDARASDPDIAAYAAANEYVVFTSDDDDFLRLDTVCGRCYYVQTNAPLVGDVLAGLRAIRDVYDDHSEIVEGVPGNWV
jgi:predicted nuclease of predicted toxin-antitoxin system